MAFDVIVIRTMNADFFAMIFSRGWLLVALLFLAGCGTPESTVHPVPIAGGKVVGIPFGPHGPLPGRANGYEVQLAATFPGEPATKIIYKFAFTAPPQAKLKRVVVDDLSDEQNGTLIDDVQPWVDDNRWHAETKPYDAKDAALLWIYTVSPSMRVYRFTITDAAGKESVLYQITPYPTYIKAAIRSTWGEKY
jgi:hypothetical protein